MNEARERIEVVDALVVRPEVQELVLMVELRIRARPPRAGCTRWRMTSRWDTFRIAPGSPPGVHGRPRCNACTLSLRCASSAHCRGHAPSTLLGHFVHAAGSNDEFLQVVADDRCSDAAGPRPRRGSGHCGANSFQTKSSVRLNLAQKAGLVHHRRGRDGFGRPHRGTGRWRRPAIA